MLFQQILEFHVLPIGPQHQGETQLSRELIREVLEEVGDETQRVMHQPYIEDKFAHGGYTLLFIRISYAVATKERDVFIHPSNELGDNAVFETLVFEHVSDCPGFEQPELVLRRVSCGVLAKVQLLCIQPLHVRLHSIVIQVRIFRYIDKFLRFELPDPAADGARSSILGRYVPPLNAFLVVILAAGRPAERHVVGFGIEIVATYQAFSLDFPAPRLECLLEVLRVAAE